MLKRTYILLFVCALALLVSERVSAQEAGTPHTISYQGILVGLDGQPVANGVHTLGLHFYADTNGVAIVWTTTINVTTKTGLFNTILGAPYTDSLPQSMTLDKPLWLGIQVDGHAEMRPLTAVTGSMYAINVVDNAISTPKIQDSAVTLEKIQPVFLGNASVNGKSITTKGGTLAFEAGRGIDLSGDTIQHTLTINSQTILDSAIAGNGLSYDSVLHRLNVNADSVTIGVINDTLRILVFGVAHLIATDSIIWNALSSAIDSSLAIQSAMAGLVKGDPAMWQALSSAMSSSQAIHAALALLIGRDSGVQNAITNLIESNVQSNPSMWNSLSISIDSSKIIQNSIVNLVLNDSAMKVALKNLVVNDIATDVNAWNSIATAMDSSSKIQSALAGLITGDTVVRNRVLTVIDAGIISDTAIQNSLTQFINKGDKGRAGAGLSFDTLRNEFNVNVDNKTIGIINDTLAVKSSGLATLILGDTTVQHSLTQYINNTNGAHAGNGISYDSAANTYNVNADNKTIGILHDTLVVKDSGIASYISKDTTIWNALAVSVDSSTVIQQSIASLISQDSAVQYSISNLFNSDTTIQNVLTTVVNNAFMADTNLQQTINSIVNISDSARAGSGLSYDTALHVFSVNVDNRTIAIVNDSLAVQGSGVAQLIQSDSGIWSAVGYAVDTSVAIKSAILDLIGSDTALVNQMNFLVSSDTSRAGNGLSFNPTTRKYDVNADNATIHITNDSLRVISGGIVNIIAHDSNAWNAVATAADSSANVQNAVLNIIALDTTLLGEIKRLIAANDTGLAGNGLSFNRLTKEYDVNADSTTIRIINDTLRVQPAGVAGMIATDTTVQKSIATAVDSSHTIQQSIVSVIAKDTSITNLVNNLVEAADSTEAGNGLFFNQSTKKYDVNVDNRSIEIANDTLQVKSYGITNAMLDSNSVTSLNIVDSTIQGKDIQIPLVLSRSTPGAVLLASNTSDNTGGTPIISFTGSSSDGTPVLRVSGSVSTGALAQFTSTAGESEAFVAEIDPPNGTSSTIEGIRGSANPGAVSTGAPLYGIYGSINGNTQGDSSAGIYGVAQATTGTVYGMIGVSASASSTAAGVKAVGGGVGTSGSPNAAALELNNGAIRVTGAAKPAGTAAATIPQGMRVVDITVNNSLALPNSYIIVSANGNGGDPALGMDKDTFDAIVRSKNAGSFTVEISCDQGNVAAQENVMLDYFIVNQ